MHVMQMDVNRPHLAASFINLTLAMHNPSDELTTEIAVGS